MSRYDVVVLGGGPGGYAAALRLRLHGMHVAVVEAGAVGGTCLHRGCVPSKALLHIAQLADSVDELDELGLAVRSGPVDTAAAGRFRDQIVSRLHAGLEGLLKASDIETIHGWGTMRAPGRVHVAGPDVELHAEHVVLALGSVPVELPGAPPDGARILSSDDALRLERVPATAAVIGGGAVGVELATVWHALGAQVRIIEGAERILPLEDPDSSRALTRALQRRGIDVRTGTGVDSVLADGETATVTSADGTATSFDQVLVAVGRRPATAGCGLEDLGVLDARGFVAVDEMGRTTVPGIWAVGDCIPTLALAHAAFAEGFVAADAIAGKAPEPVARHLIPRVTYSVPEVASVGWTEPEARERFGGDVRCTTTSLAGNARAIIEGAGGHVKLVTHADGTVVGAHVVGPGATELIGELTVVVGWEGLAAELAEVVHAHPTVSEGLREAALAASGAPFHVHA